MAGALDLLLYGVAIFISPVAVYFKKGVGAQFWVNCCLYCLLGVPGMIHAFYIIHTNKDSKKARRASPPSVHSPQTQQRYSNLPSLPHPDRYRPPASYSPYEDHPPPLPSKREDTLPYDSSLHPNATEANIGRAKAVLHTYQIPEATLHPSPTSQRGRRPALSPGQPRGEPEPEAEPLLRPPPQPQTRSEPPPAPNSTHSGSTLPYPTEYHPNAVGQNISNAKAVLHTYQIPETTFPAPEPEPEPEPEPAPAAEPEKQKRPEASATTSKGKSMWSLRNRSKGLSSLNVNSPTAVPSPGSPTTPRPKWQAGPSWLRRRKNQPQAPMITTTTDDEGAGTVTMVWDDKYDRLRPPNKSLGRVSGGSGAHARTASESMELSFPMPPGSIRPVVDRTGTSNTILRRPAVGRSESGLDAMAEESPKPEEIKSEGEGARNARRAWWDDGGKPDSTTDTETRPQHRLMRKLSRRVRPRLDIIGDTPAPGSAPSAVPASTGTPSIVPSPPKPDSPNQSRSAASPLSRHIAPPAVLASSIEEPRTGPGVFRSPRAINQASPTSPTSPTRNNVDFRIAELGLGRAGDAYSAGSRALRSNSKDQERERRPSLGAIQGSARTPKRLSTGTAVSPTSDVFTGIGSNTVPVIRRGLTQGTFGTGAGSTCATSEEGPTASKGGSNNEEHVKEEELSQDEQVERWIKREDERRSQNHSQSPTSHGHPSPDEHHATGPDAASLFSEESSGFAGVGVGSAHEKGRSGRIEVWDRPNWDGSDPSASPEASSAHQHHARYHSEDPFLDQAPSINTHSSYATGQESLPQPLSPPTSPRPGRPTRAPPAVPQTPVQAKPPTLRMDTFGAGERSAFGLLSPPATERAKGKGKERAISPPPLVPTRPGTELARPQSPKLPPKPAMLRTMSGGDEDDLSVVYARALRDEL